MVLVRFRICILLGLLLRLNMGAAEPPDAAALLAKALQQIGAKATNSAVYLYDKKTTVSSLDSKGRVAEQEVKLFLVTVTGGVPEEKLIAIEGKELSAAELKKEQEKSKRWRKFGKRKSASTKRTLIPSDLTKMFELSYVRTEKVDGRSSHVLAFKPSSSATKAKSFRDRIMGRISGQLWIDSAESEVARLEVKLGKRINIWGGVLGALNKFDLTLNRQRTPSGIWFNRLADIHLDARSLLKCFRLNLTEQSSNFRQAPNEPKPLIAH